MDILIALLNSLGISHLNALLLILIGFIAWKGLDNITRTIREQGESIISMAADVSLSKQWHDMHEKEDNRRFQEVQEAISQQRRRR